MFRLKADNLTRYRSKDPRTYPGWLSNEADLRRELTDELHQRLVAPGGSWWRHVEIYKAELAGDPEQAARLEADNRREFEQIIAGLRGVVSR